jgi:thiamine-monophosphate kinase
MGEFEFIEGIRRAFCDVGSSEIIGIGDDCAVLPIGGGEAGGSGGEAMVVTTDMLVEGVHFLRGDGDDSGNNRARELKEARELGAKSLAVNLSDIAAMGARPVASFLSIALPAECRDGGDLS